MIPRLGLFACAVIAMSVLVTASEVGPVSIYVEGSGTNVADYALTVDGAAVPILKAVSGPHAVSAVALLDTSTSITVSPLTDVTKGLARAANEGDTLRVGTFGERVLISQTVIRDNATAGRAAREASQRGGPSPLWDALYDSIDTAASSAGARVVLVYTDGRASGNDRSHREILERAAESGVTVFFVSVSDEGLRTTTTVVAVGRTAAARRIAEVTGGDLFQLHKMSDTPVHYLLHALSNFRGRVRIDFTPPARIRPTQELSVSFRGRTVRAAQRVPSG